MSNRILRRTRVPFVVVVIAATLGVFVIGRSHTTAAAPAMQNPGMRLTAAVKQTQAQQLSDGRTLFIETCSACHGGNAQGSTNPNALGPDLQGIGGAAIDLWLTAGWMPLRTPENQAEAKPEWFGSRSQILDIIAYVQSLKPGGYGVPTSIDLKNANVAQGFDMFSLNCAPCHTITGAGDALANGYRAPPLHGIAAAQVVEAIRTGPQNMPKFSTGQMNNQQMLDLVGFVTKDLEHPANIGGVGLGGVGPVAEGFVGLFVGVGLCLIAAYWVGDRTDREDHPDEHEGSDESDGDVDSDGDGDGDGDEMTVTHG